jgi:hypothetical protein
VDTFNRDFDCSTCWRGLLNTGYAISIEDNVSLKVGGLFRATQIFPGAITEKLNLEQSKQHLLVRATGGHAGMVSSSWFAEFSTNAMTGL